MSDIRKWFVKKHDKDNSNAAKPAAAKPAASKPASEKPSATTSETQKAVGQESAARRKTSKYFDKDQEKSKVGTQKMEVPAKPSPAKKVHKLEEENVDDDDDDFAPISSKKKSVDATPSKKLKGSSGRGIAKKNVVVDESDEEMDEEKETPTPVKSAGRVRGRGAAPATAAGGGGRGRGRGGFMNFGERKDPPHKGEKEVPEGSPDCLAGLTFVISGTLDSLEREEAEDLIKRHGGRVTGSVSKKTNFLLCDDDIGGRKSEKAKELGTPFLTEDGLFDMIQKSKKSKTPDQCNSKKPSESTPSSSAKKIQQNVVVKKADVGSYSANSQAPKSSTPAKKKDLSKQGPSLTWTEKYKPKVPNEIIGNQKLVKDLHDWLSHWDEQFLHNKGKRKRESNSAEKKAVLMSGTPGIGKTTSAKLVSKMLKYEIIEVNASDNRGKADSQIGKGIGGSTANSVKELISNKSLGDLDRLKHPKTVLIMDEVDGMSAGDRGGVADVIASIKISKVPIICICNDRYSQKLKSLVNYCSLYNFRKPTKQQMAKRLLQIANAEGIQVNEIALEELAERCNGDMRMAVNQLQYMSLSMSVIKYDDIRQRLLNNAKDEDISPFTAVDKLFGYNGGKLRMDERIDLSMSDLDLVPLLIQENYINYRPSSIGKDDSGMKRMSSLARVAESIADGDIINVQIRRYRQWQLSQSSCVASCILPASLMHGQREIFMPGERNFNRFGGWLGKNSTMGKNLRILEDLHVHMLASSDSYMGRGTLRTDFLTLLSKKLTEPLRTLPKEEAVKEVVEFMDTYSLSMEDYDTLMELSKFQGHPTPTDGIPPAVKSALTKGYKEGSSLRVVRTADMITLPGLKKAPKKRIAAILEPVDEIGEVNGDINEENEEEDTEDAEEDANGAKKLKLDLESNHAKGIQVQVDLKGAGSSGTKKPQKASAGRGKGGAADPGSGKKGGRGSGSSARKKK
ncbi:replication factor C subunit 1-like isoform X2 [Chenopodium quinoa]|uniref:replication factor C subunit 1-like isoform X2 n=1 Tax=Chenopodium quinoa TaxID=63459 RepID=UPI000B76FD3E|nr:replication factor C subunit 1-like isoform X2 [Chenopodium quinoa]